MPSGLAIMILEEFTDTTKSLGSVVVMILVLILTTCVFVFELRQTPRSDGDGG